jgi:uncharacterized membrane protein
MVTPIILLLLMIGPYLIMRALKRLLHRDCDLGRAAATGLALLFTMTGIGHFTETEALALMLPAWVPGRVAIVYLTGILEFAIAAGFLFRRSRRLTGWVAAAVLILFFPANVYAAIHRVPMGGHAMGPAYLLIRAPMQLIVLAWVYWFTLRDTDHER